MATSPEQNQRLQELLAAASRRDGESREAFEALYQSTSSKLFGVALRILRREDWAEEVLQECYVSIWKHCADYQLQLSAPMTWMTSIVRNRCLDLLRRPNFEDPTDDDGVFDGVESAEPGPLAELERSTEAGAIARCMGDGFTCPEGFACTSTAGNGCTAVSCVGGAFKCPVNTDCKAGSPSLHQCEKRACTTDAACDCGACIQGHCEDHLWVCSYPAA